MYEYLHQFSLNFWLAFGYVLIALGAATYLISLGVTSIHLNRLSQNAQSSPIKTVVMCFSQAAVCLIIVSNFFFPLYSVYKVPLTLVMFIFTYTARYHYWRNLSEVFNENKTLRVIYNGIVVGAIGCCLIHLFWFLMKGPGPCCLGEEYIKNPASNYILKVQIPYLMNDSFSGFVKFFTISVSLVYIRFFLISLKSRDYLMIFGLFISVLNIFYTTSYHAFGFKYWIPLYFVVDLLEYTRLQQLEVSHFAQKLKEQKQSYNSMIHDLANPLQFTNLRLQKLKRDNSINESREVKAIYEGTRSAIDILNNYKNRGTNESLISDVVEEVISIFPDIKIFYTRPHKEVRVNKGVIKNSLINLIKNSHEALKEELEWIKININNVEDRLVIKIIDNGKFVDFKSPELAFEFGASTKGDRRGVGLYSIKRDIEKLNGNLKLDNEESFTCFTIEI
ncbi:ATP-binding protein [Halobacteriovorax sp. HFRX-2_2]|uniref:sensor histidine kinase n=1 Tax=unclassified Halobacteriovorax TaxID=2639665 RepID=UPI0037196914